MSKVKRDNLKNNTDSKFNDLLKLSERTAEKLWGSKDDEVWDTV